MKYDKIKIKTVIIGNDETAINQLILERAIVQSVFDRKYTHAQIAIIKGNVSFTDSSFNSHPNDNANHKLKTSINKFLLNKRKIGFHHFKLNFLLK